ncbi:MAG TPA: hypothetical protein VF498_19435 [Anaerolineales bacterium]
MLAIFGILLTLTFFDMSGISAAPVLVNGTPLVPPDLNQVKALVDSGVKLVLSDSTPVAQPGASPLPTLFSGVQIERSNPLLGQPMPTPFITPAPTLTPTPLPPLDPVVYRTEVNLRAREYGAALQAFINANDQLAKNNALLLDPAWQNQVAPILDQVADSGQALASVGPAPAEYGIIDTWLKRVGPESDGLRQNYRQALDSGDIKALRAAGDNFIRITEDLRQAQVEMVKAGWPMQ